MQQNLTKNGLGQVRIVVASRKSAPKLNYANAIDLVDKLRVVEKHALMKHVCDVLGAI